MLEFDRNNVLMGCVAENKEQVIQALVCAMEKSGFVTADYAQNVLDRERDYPTGLPTEGVKVAIPHGSSADGILRPGVGVAVLKSAVAFANMVDCTDLLDVELVFLLANKDPQDQLEDLQKLMECFSDEELLLRLKCAKDADDLLSILEEHRIGEC